MDLTGIRQTVFLDRYALKDKEGKPIETEPEQMWRRIAHAVAHTEKKNKQDVWEEKFYQAMEDFVFVPEGEFCPARGPDIK